MLSIAAQPLALIDLLGGEDLGCPKMGYEMRGREFALKAVDPGNPFAQRILAQPTLVKILLQCLDSRGGGVTILEHPRHRS